MKHSFEAEIACKYGIEVAVVFDMFCFWISKNEANNYNFQDGKYWTFNTYEGLHKMFPYWNVQKIKRILNKMVELGLLVKGNYNENPWNHTTWYAFGEVGEKLKSALSIDWSKVTNRTVENGNCRIVKNDQCTMVKNDQSKTVIYTVSNTVNKRNIKESSDDTDLSASETIPYVEIIDYLNSKCSKRYKHSNRIAREKIHARWNEGFRLEDFKLVIDVKAYDWLNDTKMNKYLRPDTLFGSKFEIYLNSVVPKQKTNNFVITKGMKM